MRILIRQGDDVVLHIGGEDREMLLAILDAAKVTDPVVTDTSPEEIANLQRRIAEAESSNGGFAVAWNKREFLSVRRLVDAVTVIGEREEYPEHVNRMHRDEAIDRFDDLIWALYREAYP